MKKLGWFIVALCLLAACRQNKDTMIRIETTEGDICLHLYDETVLHKENMLKLIREGYYNGLLFHRVIKDFMIQTGDPQSRMARQGMILGDKGAGYTLKAEIFPRYFHKKGALAAARESDNVNPARNSDGSHFYIVQGKVFTPEELSKAVEKINNNRYLALFERLKEGRQSEIARFQLSGDYDALMRINDELSQQVRQQFDSVKLKLSDEQVKAYTTIGGSPHLDGEYTVFGEVVSGLDVVEKIAATPVDENNRPLTDVVIKRIVLE